MRDDVLDLNMRELLAEAGSSNRAFYRSFPSKDAFLMLLVESVFRESVRELTNAVSHADGPLEQLTTWVDCVLDRATEPWRTRLGRPFVRQDARLREQFPDVYAVIGLDMIALVRSAIESGVQAGVMMSESPRRDAHMIFDLTMAVTNSHVLSRILLSKAERAGVLAFVLRALHVDTGRPLG
jgi:AcrR family transcriptional regulator